MEIRLQKILAMAGVASRRKAEELIAAGRVTVNGQTAQIGAKADPANDIIALDGVLLCAEVPAYNEKSGATPFSNGNRLLPFENSFLTNKKIYIMLNKPTGVITTVTDPQDRPTVMDYVPKDVRLFPVGRLDYDTSGLLFLTNDGDWANRLTHPRYDVSKTYIARIKGVPTEEKLTALRQGIEIDKKRTSPCEIEVLKEKIGGRTAGKLAVSGDPVTSRVRITLHEGRNRQVRKMCEAIGHPVISLKRVSVGGVTLGNLPRGKWRYLTEEEIKLE